MSEALCTLGIFGLTSAGQQFAAHHASNKIRVCVADDDSSFPDLVVNEYRNQTQLSEAEEDGDGVSGYKSSTSRASRCMVPSNTLEELVVRLSQPRKIIIFGTHSQDKKFGEIWHRLCSCLDKGDIITRWGGEEESNASSFQFYSESIVENLSKVQAKAKGIHLLEMVRLERDRVTAMNEEIPEAFLVGGPQVAYEELGPFLSPYASVGHVGNSAGCAHYALMIQSAIEFGISQPLTEGSDIMKKVAGFANQDVGRIMNQWNENGILSSYLLEISSKIFYKRDDVTKKLHVIDRIVDDIDLKASDTWAMIEATKLCVPAPTLNAALEARFLSKMKDDRIEASSVLNAPSDTLVISKDQLAEDLQKAIYCTSMCAYAEGLSIFLAASEVESWDVNIAECVRLWNHPGSFLVSDLLKKIIAAFDNNSGLKSLLLDTKIATELNDLQMSWRRMPSLAFCNGIPCSTLSSSLTYYDSYRCKNLPIGLIRAQRDFYGACGYDRFDREGRFSCCWTKEHTAQRKKRNAAAALDAEAEDVEQVKSVNRNKRKTM